MRSLIDAWARALSYGAGPRLASRLRRTWARVRHPHAALSFGRGVYLGPRFSVHIPENGSLEVGDGVRLERAFRVEIAGAGRVHIEAGCTFANACLIQVSTSVEIGATCRFGPSCLIVDGSHRFRALDEPMLEQGYDFRPVLIGEGATFGARCSIMADVGAGARLAPHSVVTRPISSGAHAAGAPAREHA